LKEKFQEIDIAAHADTNYAATSARSPRLPTKAELNAAFVLRAKKMLHPQVFNRLRDAALVEVQDTPYARSSCWVKLAVFNAADYGMTQRTFAAVVEEDEDNIALC